jgi:hypothetical protein
MSVEQGRSDLWAILSGAKGMSNYDLSDESHDGVVDHVLSHRFYRPHVTNWTTLWGIASLRATPGASRSSPVWNQRPTFSRSISMQQDLAVYEYQQGLDEFCDCDSCLLESSDS